MITVVASNKDTKEDIIYELMKIETEVYDEDMRGEYESIKARFQKYPEMFFLAYDQDRIVGYFCFFPISQKLYEEVVHKGYFRDDDIKPEDIVSPEMARHLYILSVAVCKDYQDMGIADEMMKQFEEYIDKMKAEGNLFEDVCTTVVTNDGEKYAKRYGFELYFDRWQQNGYKIYAKELKNE